LIMKEKMASLGNLVAGIAHEINNPIGAINSAADVITRCNNKINDALRENESTEKMNQNQKLLQILNLVAQNSMVIQESGQRVSKIVKSLKNFARLDNAEFQQANIHEGIDNTLTLLHHELKEKITIIKDYGKIPLIYCYPIQLNQVFMNILLNAVQAIEAKGIIKIKTFVGDGKVYIKISDTGKGIPPEYLNKIFDPGFTKKGVGVGTALGLSTSYNIIQMHKGEIKVESEVGEGTTLTIILPLK
jgi:two-component system NtrC family sensor kinase